MNPQTRQSLGLLLLRIGASTLLVTKHGWPKLAHFAARSAAFSDPLGIGNVWSFTLVVFAEVVCATLVLFGLFTRLAVIPILIFFSVAVFIQHRHDPWAKKELAIIFAVPYATLLLTGPGRFSFDAAAGREKS